jgi:hypothetical protein
MATGPYRLRIVDDEPAVGAEPTREAASTPSPAASGTAWHNQAIRCVRVAVSRPAEMSLQTSWSCCNNCACNPVSGLPAPEGALPGKLHALLAVTIARTTSCTPYGLPARYVGGWGKEKG